VVAPRLFHFSDDPGIVRFEPRPARVPAARPPGREWLNGPLVWAIDADHARMYLFPRECPRILVWAKPDSTAPDRERWLGDLDDGMAAVAFLERHRHAEWACARLWRYELPADAFVDLQDAGMWVSAAPVTPRAVALVDDLPAALTRTGTALRLVDSLVPLRALWRTSLHASGIRLRNAAGWTAAVGSGGG
jgi:hypothetical protein